MPRAVVRAAARLLRPGGLFVMEHAEVQAADVRAAARAANVLEFADGLPRGLDTPIGERGAGLSAGQRQRVALARAFLRDPPLLLLDEHSAIYDAEQTARLFCAVLNSWPWPPPTPGDQARSS